MCLIRGNLALMKKIRDESKGVLEFFGINLKIWKIIMVKIYY